MNERIRILKMELVEGHVTSKAFGFKRVYAILKTIPVCMSNFHREEPAQGVNSFTNDSWLQSTN